MCLGVVKRKAIGILPWKNVFCGYIQFQRCFQQQVAGFFSHHSKWFYRVHLTWGSLSYVMDGMLRISFRIPYELWIILLLLSKFAIKCGTCIVWATDGQENLFFVCLIICALIEPTLLTEAVLWAFTLKNSLCFSVWGWFTSVVMQDPGASLDWLLISVTFWEGTVRWTDDF